jgi:hypothetical protein
VINPPPYDDSLFEQARAARQFYESNRAAIDNVIRLTETMQPYLDRMAPAIRAVQQMSQDMNPANIVARQQAAFTAMLPTIRVPTEAELAENPGPDDRAGSRDRRGARAAAVGLTVLGWLCLFVVPDAEVNRMALFWVAAAAFLMLFPPSGQ